MCLICKIKVRSGQSYLWPMYKSLNCFYSVKQCNLKLFVNFYFCLLEALSGSSGGSIYFILISMIDDEVVDDDDDEDDDEISDNVVSLKEKQNDFRFNQTQLFYSHQVFEQRSPTLLHLLF